MLTRQQKFIVTTLFEKGSINADVLIKSIEKSIENYTDINCLIDGLLEFYESKNINDNNKKYIIIEKVEENKLKIIKVIKDYLNLSLPEVCDKFKNLPLMINYNKKVFDNLTKLDARIRTVSVT